MHKALLQIESWHRPSRATSEHKAQHLMHLACVSSIPSKRLPRLCHFHVSSNISRKDLAKCWHTSDLLPYMRLCTTSGLPAVMLIGICCRGSHCGVAERTPPMGCPYFVSCAHAPRRPYKKGPRPFDLGVVVKNRVTPNWLAPDGNMD